jgi:hypothetical protein
MVLDGCETPAFKIAPNEDPYTDLSDVAVEVQEYQAAP